jgi:nucleoside-triphosphatase THEP1
MIFAVSGPPGSGKTHWIKECLAKSEGQPSRYFSAQTESIEYDYQKTCAAIIEKGLPAIFAWRLARGIEFAEKAEAPTHVCTR